MLLAAKAIASFLNVNAFIAMLSVCASDKDRCDYLLVIAHG
jgi:hypothetical protein